jgi:preprotein translocase subunit YajC
MFENLANHLMEWPMFISPAYAQAAGGGDGGFMTLVPLVLIFVVFYFLLIRPQQKKAKVHREMLLNIRRGDKIVTGGGIIGTVTKVVSDDELAVEIAEGIRIRVQRALVAAVLSRTEPVAGAAPAPAANANQGGGSILSKLFGGNR